MGRTEGISQSMGIEGIPQSVGIEGTPQSMGIEGTPQSGYWCLKREPRFLVFTIATHRI